ncbi:MAG TPA: glycosyltransferase family 4 protein [Burkholderiales bacterium]|nr:glycosyltransferase family 4 protein [Burkholderiales bacterium]
MAKRLRILTWHVHGNYLYYLSQVPHDFYVIADAMRSPGYAGRTGTLPWGDNLIDLPIEHVREQAFDCVLYQHKQGWEKDRLNLLSDAQRRLPAIYLEHDPPQEHPTDTRHWVDDANALLVHCTHFNRLMWDSGRTPTTVVEHGVKPLSAAQYSGELERGIVVVNNLPRRGRRLGADVFHTVRERVPLDLVGMDAERVGGLGEIENNALPAAMARYRFFFNPIRWTSMGLAVIEAMMVGLPIVALATTEMSAVIRDGESGYIDTRVERLVECMQALLHNPDEARALGRTARELACERFHIDRFVADWLAVFRRVCA